MSKDWGQGDGDGSGWADIRGCGSGDGYGLGTGMGSGDGRGDGSGSDEGRLKVELNILSNIPDIDLPMFLDIWEFEESREVFWKRLRGPDFCD